MQPRRRNSATGFEGNRLKTLVLGSTGSIGTQALEVIAANPDRFELVGLAAGGGNPDLLARQRAETGVTNLAVADEGAAQAVGDVTYQRSRRGDPADREHRGRRRAERAGRRARSAADPDRARLRRPAGAGQ